MAGRPTESVWDYPRPPTLVSCDRPVRIVHDGVTLAESDRAYRVLETASPPTVYLPLDDVRREHLLPTDRSTFCEWKGIAAYTDVVVGKGRVQEAGWFYPEVNAAFAELKDHISFYPGRVECYLGDERVRPQDGDFYGGWVTDEIEGPWKGAAGTRGW